MAGPSYTPGPGFGNFVNSLANPPNPMEQLGKTVNALTAVKSFQAQQASADAYKQSVDPNTGEVDLGKYKALMSQGPGAFAFGPLVTQGGQAVGAVGQGTSADVKASQDMLSGISGFLGPLYGDGKSPISPADATAAVERAKALHIATPEMINNVEAQISQLGPNGDARGLVNGMVFATGAGLEQLRIRSTPGYQSYNGGAIITDPNYSGPAPANLRYTLTPESALKASTYLAEPFSYTDKQGRIHNYTSKAQYFNEIGVNPFTLFTDQNIPAPGTDPRTLSTTPPGTAGPVSTVTTGRAPVPTAGPTPATGAPAPGSSAPAAPAAPAVPTAGPTPAPVATPPASSIESPTSPSAALPPDIVAKGQKDYATAQTNQQNLPTQLQPLRSAMGLLKTNQDLQTGPGQAQFAQAVTGIAAALNIKVPSGSTDLQELTKALVQNVRAQETGGSTDLDRLQTEAANPNPTTQSRDALLVLLAKQVGATRLQAGALDYFNSKYPDAQTAATNSGRFNIDTTDWKKKQDPTAWAIDELPPDQVARYFNGLSGTYDAKTGVATGDRATFIHSLRDARTIGGLAGGAPPPLPAGIP